MSTLRDMLQSMILLILLCILMGSHQNLPHSHSSLELLKFSSNTHSRGTLFATRSSTFTTQQPRSAATLWLLICSFYVNCTWRENSRHQTTTHKTATNSFCLGSDLTTRSGRHDDYKDSLSEILFFFGTRHKQGHMKCKLTGWLWAKQLSEQSAFHIPENGLWQSLTSEQDNRGQVAEMTKTRSPVTPCHPATAPGHRGTAARCVPPCALTALPRCRRSSSDSMTRLQPLGEKSSSS